MKDKDRFRLKWPWNVVAYIGVTFVLGYCIGYLWSILLAVWFYHYQKKKHPEMPEGGYCLARTRKRLIYVPLNLLILLLGVGMLAFTWEHRPGSELYEPVKYMTGWAIGLVLCAVALYEMYSNIRDVLFPDKSTLAQSIRSQMPDPEATAQTPELFAMVDRDIETNGQWFDQVVVGKKWVLGDTACYIPRVRAVFGRDEIRQHHANGQTNGGRIIQVFLMDDRRQVQILKLKNPNELPMLLDCLRLRTPDAYFGSFEDDYEAFRKKSEDEWYAFERKFRQKKNQRELRQFEEDVPKEQSMILTRADGSVTSRVEEGLIKQLLGKEQFSLAAGQSVRSDGRYFTELRYVPVGEAEAELVLKEVRKDQHKEYGLRQIVGQIEAKHILEDWIQRKIPNLAGWERIYLNVFRPEEKYENPPPELWLVSNSGIRQQHHTFTREDIEVLAEGLVDGSYQKMQLTFYGYLFMQIETGNQFDGRCTVCVTHPDGDELRLFETKSTSRQAARWLLEFCDGSFSPDWSTWKDNTKKLSQK